MSLHKDNADNLDNDVTAVVIPCLFSQKHPSKYNGKKIVPFFEAIYSEMKTVIAGYYD